MKKILFLSFASMAVTAFIATAQQGVPVTAARSFAAPVVAAPVAARIGAPVGAPVAIVTPPPLTAHHFPEAHPPPLIRIFTYTFGAGREARII